MAATNYSQCFSIARGSLKIPQPSQSSLVYRIGIKDTDGRVYYLMATAMKSAEYVPEGSQNYRELHFVFEGVVAEDAVDAALEQQGGLFATASSIQTTLKQQADAAGRAYVRRIRLEETDEHPDA